MLEHDRCLEAIRAKDRRFDGFFFTAVTSTGIYCRPSCPAMTPLAKNVRFYPSAAAAQVNGFRACKRCRPDASPGSPEWNARGDVAARAMRMISDGVVDREGVAGLAAHLGYSTRQLQRLLEAELGAPALAIARAQRAQTARILLESTELPMSAVAFASGFSSIRQFNETVAELYASTPSALRRARGVTPTGSGAITLRLAYRAPLHVEGLFGHLVATAVSGVEAWDGQWYRRTLRLEHGVGVASLRPDDGYVTCQLELTELRDLASAVARCRRLLDLDADPVAIDAHLSRDLVLARLVRRGAGRRIPGTVDGAEWAMRVILGQQVSTSAARTHAARLAEALGDSYASTHAGLTRLFPSAASVADAPDELLRLPAARRRTLREVAHSLAVGDLDLSPGADRERTVVALQEFIGVGSWSVESITMRALGEPDAMLASDLGVVSAARALGLASNARSLVQRSAPWRPWRSYAVQYLWSTGDHAINRLPAREEVTTT